MPRNETTKTKHLVKKLNHEFSWIDNLILTVPDTVGICKPAKVFLQEHLSPQMGQFSVWALKAYLWLPMMRCIKAHLSPPHPTKKKIDKYFFVGFCHRSYCSKILITSSWNTTMRWLLYKTLTINVRQFDCEFPPKFSLNLNGCQEVL